MNVQTSCFFLAETWMKSHGDEAKCADLNPPGYRPTSLPHATWAGGLAIIVRDSLPVTVITSFPFPHTTFKLIQLTLSAPMHLHCSCLYRPPPSTSNKLKESTCFAGFPDFLEHSLQPSVGAHFSFWGISTLTTIVPENLPPSRMDITSTFSLDQAASVTEPPPP